MKALLLLVLGFTAGFLAGNWRISEKKNGVAEVASCGIPPEPRSKFMTIRTQFLNVEGELPRPIEGSSSATLEAISEIHDSVALPRSARAPQDVRSRFDEFLLQEIEASLESTRSKVQLTRDPAGWRVRSLQPGSPLDRLSLREGDLITRVHAEDAEFRARMESVLDQLL